MVGAASALQLGTGGLTAFWEAGSAGTITTMTLYALIANDGHQAKAVIAASV